jgi:hypothetical protein
VAEPNHNLRKQLEPVAPLVRDENAKMQRVAVVQRQDDPGACTRIARTFDPRIPAVVRETTSLTSAHE